MAHLSDMPRVFRSVGLVPFAKRVWGEILDDDLFTWASALAYSWLLAVFPFLIFLLTLVPHLPERIQQGAEDEVHKMVDTAAPSPEAAQTLWDATYNNRYNILHRKEGKGLPRLLGLGLALWAASGGMSMTLSALDKCYDLQRGRPFYQQRVMSVALTVVAMVLMVCVISLLPVGTLTSHWLVASGRLAKHSPALLTFNVLRFVLSVVFLLSVLALIYHFGPSIRHRFVFLTPGAVFSVTVWLTLGFLFRLYVVKWGKYNQTYGAVGGVAVLLLFFYIDALVLLVGAEIDSEVDFEVLKIRRGTRDFSKAEDLSVAPPTDI
jgi:membrane protein